ICIFFSRAVFSSDSFLYGDTVRVYLPLKHYWVERVRRGEFPAWYPYDGMGQPFLPMLLNGVLHPLNVLFLLLPLAQAFKWSSLIAYFAAFCGGFFFLRGHGRSKASASLGAI